MLSHGFDGRILRIAECRRQPGMWRNIMTAQLDLPAGATPLLCGSETRCPAVARLTVTALDERAIDPRRRCAIGLAGVPAALARLQARAGITRPHQDTHVRQVAANLHRDDDVFGELASFARRGRFRGRLDDLTRGFKRRPRNLLRESQWKPIEPARQLRESAYFKGVRHWVRNLR